MIFQKRSCFERGVYRSIESFLAYFLRVTLASRNLVAKLLYSSDMPKCSSYRSVLSSYEHLTCCFVWSASPGCECARFLTFQPFVVCRPGNVQFLKTTTTASLKLCRKTFIQTKSLCARAVRPYDVSVGISRERYEHTNRQQEVGNFASHRSVLFWHNFLDESHFFVHWDPC